jgi:Cellulose-binding Sde182, nucleoside hydrolase-like domain/Cellulose-binding protein Sde0182, C-terminal domain
VCALLGVVAHDLAVHTAAAVAFEAAPATASGQAGKPHRMIVLSDIGADPDDTQSFVRLLLYADVIDLEGLIATTSTWKRTSVAPESIRAVIRAYGAVYGNLVEHDAHYPRPEALQALVKRGRAEYGMGGVGAGKDSEGSDWIVQTLEKNDDRPLWITVWGGANTLAQALYTLRAMRPAAEVDRLLAKLRVYTISDQDDSGPWIRTTFPSLFYIVTPGGDYGAATWGGINTVVPGIDNTSISNKWIAEHIQQGHGPLGAAYPDVAWGMEGDTPSWLGLIPNGLGDPEHPDWGGWGGRYELYRPDVPVADPKTFIGGVPIEPETRPIWTNATDDYTPPVVGEYGRATRPGGQSFRDSKATLWRWRDDFQNDFAARMEWATKSYAGANHPPVPVLGHPDAFTVRSGEGFGLDAHGTMDPDGDSLSYYWFPYSEAGTYAGTVKVDGAENAVGAWVIAPKVEKPATIHFILRVTDKGRPPLSRYKRVVVTVTP